MKKIRPSNELIHAWHDYMRIKAMAQVARMKSLAMFKHSEHDIELYNRANILAKQGRRLDAHADVKFRQAIQAEWGKRYRIWWVDATTCSVYVHNAYEKDEQVMMFTKSIRARKSCHV